MTFKKILLPYDGSDKSDAAYKHALELASLIPNCEIVILHVVSEIHLPPSFDYGMSLPGKKSSREYLKELYQNMEKSARQMLETKFNKIEKGISGSITTRIVVVLGHPAQKIIEVATDEKADLIIIGNTGLSGLARVKALGSVSRAVTETAPCPVMVVHQQGSNNS